MFCGIVDFYSKKNHTDTLFSMGENQKSALPYASAYIKSGTALLSRTLDKSFPFPYTKGKHTILIDVKHAEAEQIIDDFAVGSTDFLRSICTPTSLAIFDSASEELYLFYTNGGAPIYFAEDTKLTFTTCPNHTTHESFSHLAERSILIYNRTGLSIIK